MKLENARLFLQTQAGEEEFKGIDFSNDIFAAEEVFGRIATKTKKAAIVLSELATLQLSGSIGTVSGDLLKGELIQNATPTSMTMIVPERIQNRRHKKKRINKKWARRYGYKRLYTPFGLTEIKEIGRNGDMVTFEAKLK